MHFISQEDENLAEIKLMKVLAYSSYFRALR